MDKGMEALLISQRGIEKKLLRRVKADLREDRCPAEFLKGEIERLYPYYWIEEARWN